MPLSLALTLAALSFFICGLSTVMNDILIPYLQTKNDFTYTTIIFLQTSFYFGYFLLSPLSGYLFRKRGYLFGIRVGLLIGAVATAAIAWFGSKSSYEWILFSIFLLGSGIAIIQVHANPYALILGPSKTASSRLSLTQSLTSVGTVIAPYLGSYCILSTLCNANANPLTGTYSGLALVWISLLLFSFFFPMPKGDIAKKQTNESINILPLLLGIVGIFTYVGFEVTVGSFLVKYLSEPTVCNISLESAGFFSMLFWAGLMIGRLLGCCLLRHYTPQSLLLIHTSASLILSGLVTFTYGTLAAFSAIALGLAMSVLFPVIYSLALAANHKRPSETSGYLCMANIGGAIIPLAQGLLADQIGLHHSFIVPFLCALFLVILYPLNLKLQERIIVEKIKPIN